MSRNVKVALGVLLIGVALIAQQPFSMLQVGGNTILTGNGTTGTGSPRVTIASDNTAFSVNATLSAETTKVIGTVNQGTSPWVVNQQPGTTGGLTWFPLQPTASDNHQVIKAGAGQVYHITATNNSGTVNYLRLYNATTGFNGCNSATNLVHEIIIPANTSGAGFVEDISQGMAFSTGISICVTSGYGNTDTTNATATAMMVDVGYK